MNVYVTTKRIHWPKAWAPAESCPISTNTFLKRLIASYAQEYREKFNSFNFYARACVFPTKKKRAINFNAAVEIADTGNLYAPLTYGKTHATHESNFMSEGGEKRRILFST